MIGATNGSVQIIKIEIASNDILAFRQVKAYWPDIQILVASGVFDFRGGKAIIHRDKDGKLRKVDLELTKFIS